MSNISNRRRRSIRLRNFDYSLPGAYFVTICCHDRTCVLGEIENGQMNLNEAGHRVLACWNDLPNHFPHVRLDAFVVMPNHVHGVVVLTPDRASASDFPLGEGEWGVVGAGLRPAPTPAGDAPPSADTSHQVARHGLPEIVRAFKAFSARRINELQGTPGMPVWQRNYYEHVVRDPAALDRIRQYILNNPQQWDLDQENPAHQRGRPR